MELQTDIKIVLKYSKSTIFLQLFQPFNCFIPDFIQKFLFDERNKGYRCQGILYRKLILELIKEKIPFEDDVKNYKKLSLKNFNIPQPYNYQSEALETWLNSKWGVIVLPTGAGKSILGGMAIHKISRSTLVLVPTIDLMRQWKKNLTDIFRQKIGALGGGEFEILDITVSTYDSARIHLNKLGNNFGMVIFDECHHLPSPAYAEIARTLIAPYRIGLTATPPEEEERMAVLNELCGEIKFNKEILELSGKYLSEYEVRTITVNLSAEEKSLYDHHRNIYLSFRSQAQLWGMGKLEKWEQFVALASRTKKGRDALKSFGIQKQLFIAAREKFVYLIDILLRHSQDKVLIFTHDNKTAYYISCLLMLPLLTHVSSPVERKKTLRNFRSGRWPFLVSSRVLNEGVDIPDANVAVIVSGTGTVREHVQRLGRILRKQKSKKAILYEIITVDTGEVNTSRRRRMHEAYKYS